MAFTAVTNATGSNPGPNSSSLPDTVQMPTGNTWKVAQFTVTLSPTSVANATSAEQTFAASATIQTYGLLTTDTVLVQKPTAQAGLGIVGSRVSAADTLAITFMNTTAATITPTASEVYKVTVLRPQPNWTQPAGGATAIDW